MNCIYILTSIFHKNTDDPRSLPCWFILSRPQHLYVIIVHENRFEPSTLSTGMPFSISTNAHGSLTAPLAVSCYHAANPHNACAAITDEPGPRECGDDESATYVVMPLLCPNPVEGVQHQQQQTSITWRRRLPMFNLIVV